MIDILSFIEQRASIALAGKPTRHHRNGQELHSNCPWCNGKDRFVLWPDVGRFMCRQCGHYGDMIGFLMQYENMSYYEACRILDIDPKYPEDAHPELPLFMTKDEPPPLKWQESAELFVSRAERYLWTSGGKRGLDYLHSRGFKDDTLRTARIGFCPDWFSDNLSNWGLSIIQTDQEEEIKIPLGIVIPWFVDGCVWKLSIRRPDKTYFQVLGSSDGALYNMDTLKPGSPAVLCESEFDALSAMQEAGDLVASIATGGASKGQTSPLRHSLKKASHLLIGFDSDKAGDDGSQHWLKLPNSLRWTPWRHDINELLQQQDILVRMWVESGLKAAVMEIPQRETEEISPVVTSLPAEPEISDGKPPFRCRFCKIRKWMWYSEDQEYICFYCFSPASWTEKYLEKHTSLVFSCGKV